MSIGLFFKKIIKEQERWIKEFRPKMPFKFQWMWENYYYEASSKRKTLGGEIEGEDILCVVYYIR